MIPPRNQDDQPGVVAQLRQDYLGPFAVPRCEYGKRVEFGTYLLDRLEDRLGRLPLLGCRREIGASSVPGTICRALRTCRSRAAQRAAAIDSLVPLTPTTTGFVVSDVSGLPRTDDDHRCLSRLGHRGADRTQQLAGEPSASTAANHHQLRVLGFVD